MAERAYHAALAYYFKMGYTLVVLGDVEELWEERAKPVLTAYAHTIEMESQFHQQGRYWRFWGNHDDDWRFEGPLKRHLVPRYGAPSLKVRECLRLKVTDGAQELGAIFLLHGHQGTTESDRFAGISRLAVRFIWRPIQRIFKISLNTPATSWELRERHNVALYTWAEKQNKLVLIAGHTHRPVFKSRSHHAQIKEQLDALEEQLAARPDDAELRNKAALCFAELEWVRAQEFQQPGQEATVPMKRPCYFNTGCCSFFDGDITGIEIAGGEFRLVRWPDQNKPKRCILEFAEIKSVFAAC
ncbi:MAG: hypothetical protein A2Z03_07935 [Chloroflexi bacterium RBG_16_56_8]|nr:MAG: hypothetical protein A2Z03_07935 [Chloroflexi bacterium RBG_16_56_8]